MKAKFLFVFGLFSLLTACLDSTYTIEVETSNDISFDDCPYYNFWADTLWCADTLKFHATNNELKLGNKLHIRALQFMDVHDWPDYRRTSFNFIIHDFQGIGKYSYPTAESADYYGDDFEFKIVDWDVVSTKFNIEDVAEGDYGEVVITQFDPNTGFIKGEARGLLSDARGGKTKQTLHGGRFQGFFSP